MRTTDALNVAKGARKLARPRGMWWLGARLGLAALSAVGIGLAAMSCSVIVDSKAEQCQADADCTGALAGRTCKEGLCVDPGETGCTVNAQCVNEGPFHVCRNKKCVSLTNELCSTVYTTKKNAADAYRDDHAFVFGSILSTVGADTEYGVLLENSIKLAIDDFSVKNGLPALSGGTTRPIVLVGCNAGENEDKAKEAAEHLVNDLGVPAIVGYVRSGVTIQIATEVAIPKGVVLFSSSATSDDITKLEDQDLVWRTSPPDSFQATALAKNYPDVEARTRSYFPNIPANGIKVAIVHTSDSYGVGLADAVQSQLMFNGKTALEQSGSNFKRFNYGAPEAPELAQVGSVVSFAPHVVFVFGFNEGVDPIFTAIEEQWVLPADMHRPFWVFSDAAVVPELWGKAITAEEADKKHARTRVLGSTPGVLKTYAPYSTFLTLFDASPYSMNSAVSADVSGAAGAYDITYLLAYSAVGVGANSMTGSNLVKFGLRKMIKGQTKVKVGGQGINDAFSKLSSGVEINFEGSSGPLDFDQFGEAPSDIQIWCVPPGTAPAVADPVINSGRYFDSTLGTMAGTISADCALPAVP